MSTSLIRRVVRTFVSPGELFDELRESPRGWGVLVTGAAVVMGSTALVPPEAWELMLQERLPVSDEALPADLESVAPVMRWTGIVGAGVFWCVWALFLGGGSALLFEFVLGDEGTFRQYFAVGAHAMLVLALGAVVTLPLKIVQLDPTVSLSLATFAVGLEEGYLVRVLKMLDLFLLWALVLVALGASRLDRDRSWSSASALLLSLFCAVALLVAAIPGA